MFGRGDLVTVHPRWTNRGKEDTVYIVTSVCWKGHCLELELLDPLGDGRIERVSEYRAQKLKNVPAEVSSDPEMN